jgi:solute carrier family 29 (equilibrative nucleoside transporter) protein 4
MVSLFSMALLVALTSFNVVDSNVGFLVTIGATAFTGIGCGVQEASYYGYAGMLPSKYTRAIMLGESFAGLVVSVNRIVTKLTIEDPLTNTVIFFSLSIVGEIVCIFLHRFIKKSKFVKYYKAKERAGKHHTAVSFSPIPSKTKNSIWASVKEGLKMRLKLSRKIWKLMFGILNVYFVTNLLYPGVASVIQSSWPNGWLPVALITAFNLSDMVGTLATGLPWKMPDNVLLLTGSLRWSLVPLLLMSVLPLHAPLVSGEGSPLVCVLILGFTTGYMGSTPMCAAAGKVNLAEREMAGNLMTMMMLLGLTMGSSSALVVNKVIGIAGHAEF